MSFQLAAFLVAQVVLQSPVEAGLTPDVRTPAPAVCTSTTTITTGLRACTSPQENAASGPEGHSAFSWTITNGSIIGSTTLHWIRFVPAGLGSVGLGLTSTNESGCTGYASAELPVVVTPPRPVISAPFFTPVGAAFTASVPGTPGHWYHWGCSGCGLSPGDITSPTMTYQPGTPGTRMELQVIETADNGFCLSEPSLRHLIMVDFLDVPPSHPWHSFVISAGLAGVAEAYGPGGNLVINRPMKRGTMAFYLLRVTHGDTYVPPVATGIFADVPVGLYRGEFMEQLYNEGITAGCATNPLRYCPGNAMLRSQMAILLLRAKHGTQYVPPVATGVFGDVPIGSFAADWIEQLYEEGITGGCSADPPLYCPNEPLSVGAMTVFVTRTFNLPPEVIVGN